MLTLRFFPRNAADCASQGSHVRRMLMDFTSRATLLPLADSAGILDSKLFKNFRAVARLYYRHGFRGPTGDRLEYCRSHFFEALLTFKIVVKTKFFFSLCIIYSSYLFIYLFKQRRKFGQQSRVRL